MRSPLTHFGQQYFTPVARLRLAAALSALVVASIVQLFFLTYSLVPLLILLSGEVLLNAGMLFLSSRLPPRHLMHGTLIADVAVITLLVFYTGGIQGSFATLYVWVMLLAAFWLGSSSFFLYGLLSFIGFALVAELELLGIHTPQPPQPPVIAVLSQATLLGILAAFAYFLNQASRQLENNLEGEKANLLVLHEQAERARRRWELVNTVALRIQEATTLEQVYATIGEELEALGQHCIIWQRNEADQTLQLAYLSLGERLVQVAQAALKLKPEEVRLSLARVEDIQKCIDSRTPILINDPLASAARSVPALPSQVLLRVLRNVGLKRAVNAPLLIHERVIGVLTVWGEQLDEGDVPPLAALAQQTASALEKATLLAQAQKRAAQLRLVSEIAARAEAIYDAQELMDQVVSLVVERFGYELAVILLRDPARGDLYLTTARGAFAAQIPPGYRQAWDVGILGQVMQTGKTYLAPEVQTDPYYLSPIGHGDPARSELTVPLRQAGRVVGVLDLESTTVNAFEASDVAAMETLADQVSATLEKSGALELQRKRALQLQSVSEIAARIVGLLDVAELFDEITRLIVERLGYENTSIFINEPAARQVVMRAHAGLSINSTPMGYRQSWEVGLIGLAARGGGTVVVNDVRRDPRYLNVNASENACRSELCIPLKQEAGVFGVLDIQSTRENAFEAEDVRALETLADQIAVALEKGQLLQSERQRAEELETLRQLSLDLSAERDLGVLLHSIAEKATRLLQAKGASIYTLDEARGELQCEIVYQRPQVRLGTRLRLGEGLAGKVAAQGEPIFVEDYRTWEGRAELLADESVHQLLGLPLKWQTRILGVLSLHRDESSPRFTQDDLHLANLFAAQAAAALENARLLAEVQNQLQAQQALAELSHAFLETLDSARILQSAATSAAQALNAEAASVLLPEGETELVMRAQYGWGADVINQRIPLDTTTGPGMAMQTGQPVIWNDKDPADMSFAAPFARAHGFRSGLTAPMVTGDKVVGVIVLSTPQARRFGAHDIQMLSLLANQTAIALQRAHYFEQMQQSTQELNLLFETQRATTSTLEPEQAAARLLEQLTHALDVTSAYFVLVDETRETARVLQEFHTETAVPRQRGRGWPDFRFDDFPAIRTVLKEGPLVLQRADPDLSPEEQRTLDLHGAQTILRVPLRHGGQVLGYLSLLESRAPRAWSARELRFVQTVAAHAAIAFANAELYTETKTRTRELEALYQASYRLNFSLSVDDICEASVEALREILGYKHVSLFFVQDDLLRMKVQHGYEMTLETIDRQHGIIGRAFRMQQLMFIPDVETDPEFIAAIPGIQSEIAVPLLHGDHVLGILNVETLKPHRLTEADVRLVTTFANQLVTAIQNARLYEDARQRLHETRTLYEFTTALNQAVGLEALAQCALDSIARLIPFDLAEVSLVGEASGTVFPIVMGGPGLTPELLAREMRGVLHEHGLQRGIGIVGWTVEHGESVCVGDVTRDRRYLPLSPRMRSELCVPMRSGERIIGAVNLESERLDAFDAHSERLLGTLANQLAIALVDAHLFEQTRRDAEVKTALLREVSHRVKNNLAGIISLLYLALDAAGETREEILRETVGRAESMMLAHTLLARSQRARVNLAELGRQVLNDAVHHLAPPGSAFDVQVEGASVEITPHQLNALALVLNELATNALHHGFIEHGLTRGHLCFQVERGDRASHFTLSDDGGGLPDNFHLDASVGLGLSLVQTLVTKDLQGVFKLERDHGWTRASVQFALEE
jgi:two-component system, sensor histidine kinase PdtaS